MTERGTAESFARTLAKRVAAQREPLEVTLRELRDGSWGGGRLTLGRRHALERALRDAGVVASVPLAEASLDDKFELSRVRAGWATRLGRWIAHPFVAGTRQLVRYAIGVLALAATVVTLVPYLAGGDEPKRMTGELNVLAAGFVSPESAEAGLALADSVTRSLRSLLPIRRVAEAPDVQVRGVTDAAPADASAVRALAERNGADVVVHGEVARIDGRTILEPRLYVDPRQLVGAEELGGDYPLAKIDAGRLPVDDADAARAGLRSALVGHLRGLAAFSAGLGWYRLGRWHEASGWFDKAAAAWPAGLHGAMVRLFAGNAAGKLDRLERAAQLYRRALSLAPSLGRAQLGLTEVRLHRAQRGCGPRADAAGLNRAANDYAVAGAGEVPAGLSGQALRLRSRLGQARADLCLSQAGLHNRWATARDGFRRVIALGASHGERFRTERSEAHAGLAFVLLPTGPTAPDAVGGYRDAREQYLMARRLSDDRRRQAVFERFVAFIDARLRAAGRRRTGALPHVPDPGSGYVAPFADPDARRLEFQR